MLTWISAFVVVAVIAGMVGFATGFVAASKALFVIFLIPLVVLLIGAALKRPSLDSQDSIRYPRRS